MSNVYYILDLETTVKGGPEKTSPEAHWLDNEVLMCGYTTPTGVLWTDTTTTRLCNNIYNSTNNGDQVWLVAHNAKFDIKYLMRNHPEVEWNKVKVWDTMTWEYRDSGQQDTFISLEDACTKRGIPFKKGLDLGALLKAGVKMEDIPKADLKDYLREDVLALDRLFKAQQKTGYVPDMDYILPLAEMELNGLYIDREKAERLMKSLTLETNTIEADFIDHITANCEWQDGTPIVLDDFYDTMGTKSKTINPMAARTLSFLLTCAPASLQITNKWSVHYKKGHGPHYPVWPHAGKPTNLGYPMSEDILNQLTDPLSKYTLEYRKANKLLSTYVGPFLHASSVQGTIHPKLNTTVTATGRLSSSAPNGQNCPPLARGLVIAPIGWHMEELDFSQLEVVASACITGCMPLQQALNTGEDIHYNSGKRIMGWMSPSDMTKEARTLVKNVNFGAIYGGKATGLSKQTGVDKDKIQKLIDAFYRAYPRVAQWQKDLFNEVISNMKADGIKGGEQVYSSHYTEPFSGRKFLFKEQKSPAWLRKKTGRSYSFSPNQIYNYPIQGFAGGDIVMFALTELWRSLRPWKIAKFVMTVHDSILLEVVDGTDVTTHMDRACRATEKHFNLPVKLSFESKQGLTWQ